MKEIFITPPSRKPKITPLSSETLLNRFGFPKYISSSTRPGHPYHSHIPHPQAKYYGNRSPLIKSHSNRLPTAGSNGDKQGPFRLLERESRIQRIRTSLGNDVQQLSPVKMGKENEDFGSSRQVDTKTAATAPTRRRFASVEQREHVRRYVARTVREENAKLAEPEDQPGMSQSDLLREYIDTTPPQSNIWNGGRQLDAMRDGGGIRGRVMQRKEERDELSNRFITPIPNRTFSRIGHTPSSFRTEQEPLIHLPRDHQEDIIQLNDVVPSENGMGRDGLRRSLGQVDLSASMGGFSDAETPGGYRFFPSQREEQLPGLNQQPRFIAFTNFDSYEPPSIGDCPSTPPRSVKTVTDMELLSTPGDSPGMLGLGIVCPTRSPSLMDMSPSPMRTMESLFTPPPQNQGPRRRQVTIKDLGMYNSDTETDEGTNEEMGLSFCTRRERERIRLSETLPIPPTARERVFERPRSRTTSSMYSLTLPFRRIGGRRHHRESYPFGHPIGKLVFFGLVVFLLASLCGLGSQGTEFSMTSTRVNHTGWPQILMGDDHQVLNGLQGLPFWTEQACASHTVINLPEAQRDILSITITRSALKDHTRSQVLHRSERNSCGPAPREDLRNFDLFDCAKWTPRLRRWRTLLCEGHGPPTAVK